MGPSFTITTCPACIVNGVRFVVESRDAKHKTQNSGVSVPGTEGNTFYGVLEEIIELQYLNKYSVILFRCKWYDTDPRKRKIYVEKNITSISISSQWYKDDPYILASQAKQVFYIEDLVNGSNWRVVQDVMQRDIWDIPDDNQPVQTMEFLQASNSSSFRLMVDLGDLNVTVLKDLNNNAEFASSSRNIGSVGDRVDDFIFDEHTLEDETIDDYVEEGTLQSDDDFDTNDDDDDDDDPLTFTDTDTDTN